VYNPADGKPIPEGRPATGKLVLGGCVVTESFKRRTASRQAERLKGLSPESDAMGRMTLLKKRKSKRA